MFLLHKSTILSLSDIFSFPPLKKISRNILTN
uniref:Uncharacterized protein n=1 Tax=virus sp. ct6Ax4 TaxID=2826791 RepID=A0A8S5R678_9VIRU|nr:MAG TPA: hypothetical protein [virus sp. ct6Ax4]DAH37421.1 MAG TPA: hypothetical protein [Caudoviricetes sp.]